MVASLEKDGEAIATNRGLAEHVRQHQQHLSYKTHWMVAVLTKVIFGTAVAQGQTQKAARSDEDAESEVVAIRSRLATAVGALTSRQHGGYIGGALVDSPEELRDATGLELDEPPYAWAQNDENKQT
jgi:hypothetical protein